MTLILTLTLIMTLALTLTLTLTLSLILTLALNLAYPSINLALTLILVRDAFYRNERQIGRRGGCLYLCLCLGLVSLVGLVL